MTQYAGVPGGRLAFEVFDGTAEPVLAIHGVSSHRRLWLWLHEEAPELTLVAPDLRGRGDSVDVRGASSPQRHADDLVAVLDALELEAVHTLGMSMGGFVAVHLAVRHPDRVKSLILVDGGFPMTRPPGLTRETIPAAFADRVGRLSRSWASIENYLDYFCASTAPMLDRHDPLLRRYAEHDLRGGRVRLSGAALVEDAAEIFFGATPWDQVAAPIRFLHAEWSTGRDTPPAYGPDAVARYAPATVETVAASGVDHAGSIMTPAGARATAGLVRKAIA